MSSTKGGSGCEPPRCFRAQARDPSSSGLDLAVLSGNVGAAVAILSTLRGPARVAAAAAAAAKYTPRSLPLAAGGGASGSANCGDAAVLEVLIEAGADPFALLHRLLLRYEWSVQAVHQQPFYQQPSAYRSALAAVLRSRRCLAAAEAGAGGPQGAVCTPEQHSNLLLAAVCCREERLCLRLIAAAGDACWVRHAANCRLLVAAAEHDLPAVVAALLAVRTRGGGQPFSVAAPPGAAGLAAAGGMAYEGCTPLMAAAERNSCAALRLLLAQGAAVNAADEDGVSALHWAVIGGAYEAAELLLQAGASPTQPCAAQPDGLHLERPLLTAVKEGQCQVARLLLAHGAQLAAPTERGCTALSVALAFQQVEAARMLLALGADARQALPPQLNGGRYRDASLAGSGPPQAGAQGAAPPASSYASLLGLAASRRQQAAPLIDLLLGAGATPAAGAAVDGSVPGPAGSEDAPLVAAAAAGAVGGVAHLLRWAQHRGVSLLQLGWSTAAVAAARHSLASDRHHEALCLLLHAWQLQQAEQGSSAPGAALPASTCTALVQALLDAHTQQQATHVAAGQDLDAGCELQAVLLAERLAELGLSADLTATLAAAPHNRGVALAALPPGQRWSHANHRFFPPAFKAAARELLLVAARQQRRQQQVEATRSEVAPAGASLASLPDHLVYHTIQLASAPISFWLNKH